MSATPSANAVAGATETNQRLFLRFRKVFSENNPREFTLHAEKLAKWLNDRKAYYDAARPEIIRLLLVAETTVRAALNVPSPELITPFNIHEHPPHPLVAPYVSMVQTVCRFEEAFEPAFQEYLKRMRANISLPTTHPPLPTMEQKHKLSSGAPQPLKVTAQPLSDPDIQIIEKPQPRYPDVPPPPHSANGEASSSTTAQVSAPVRTRKVKKKKTLDFDALAKADIEDALLKQKRAQTEDSSSRVHEEAPLFSSPPAAPEMSGTVPPPSARFRSAAIIEDGSMQESLGGPTVASETKTTTNPMRTTTPLASSPRPLVHHAPMEVDNQFGVEAINSTQMRKDLGASPTPIIDARTVNQASGPQTQTALTRRPIGQTSSVEGPQLSMHASPSAAQVVAAHQQEMAPASTGLPEALSMDVDDQEQSAPLREVDQSQTMDIDIILPTGANTLTSGTKNVDLSKPPLSQVQQDTLRLPASDTVSASSSMSISPSQQDSNGGRHVQVSNGEQSLDILHSTIPSSLKPVPLTADHDQPTDIFADRSVRVVTLQKGPSNGSRITINFVIEKEKFSGIATWNSRQTGQKPHLRDLETSGQCVSLGCFATDQLAAQRRKEGCDTIEKQLASLYPIWPSGDQVSIEVTFEEKRTKLPLSPPFQVTPDNFVDISQFTHEGANVVQLSHLRDLSRYTFVLLVHHPTQAQLKQVGEQQQQDNEWEEWTKYLTRPFSIPLQIGPDVI